MKYIALLRGINVGGNNKISMSELKAAFVKNGFSNVKTYINSGNVIFESNEDADTLKTVCESLIAEEFGLHIAVAIVSADELSEALNNAPVWWNTDKDSKHNAIFVIPPATPEEIFTQVGECKPEYEKTDVYGRVIFWSAPLETFSRTRWSKIIGTSAYDSITIRNANTAVKLMQIANT